MRPRGRRRSPRRSRRLTAMWLSLMSAASPSPIRWLRPPPHRTAYFSSWRSPGVVLRVSRTVHPVPDRASAQAPVAVAIPDRWVRKLSRVRSAPSSSRIGAVMRISSAPASIRSPSARSGSADSGGIPAASRTARATGTPASTPGWRATAPATARESGAAVAAEVTSGPYRRSSSSAPRTARSVSSGSRPAASRLLGHHRVQSHSRAPTFALAVPVTRSRPSSTCTMVWRAELAGSAGSAGPGGGWSRHR